MRLLTIRIDESMLRSVNTVLAFQGLEFREDGEFHSIKPVSTLTEAEKRAQKLKASVFDRKLHNDLLRFCRTELLQDNYFHAVLEATKSIASKVRSMTGLSSDGAQLIDAAFGGSNPLLKINAFKTDTEKSEQRGFTNLAKGLFGIFRNPTAHAPKRLRITERIWLRAFGTPRKFCFAGLQIRS
jgi:uncharacterized protein (TIGR02391 family)